MYVGESWTYVGMIGKKNDCESDKLDAYNCMIKDKTNIVESTKKDRTWVCGSDAELKKYTESNMSLSDKVYIAISFLFFLPVEKDIYYFDFFDKFDSSERQYERMRDQIVIEDSLDIKKEIKKDKNYRDKYNTEYKKILKLFLNNDESLKTFFKIILDVTKDVKKERKQEILEQIKDEKYNHFRIKKAFIKKYYDSEVKVVEFLKSSKYLELYNFVYSSKFFNEYSKEKFEYYSILYEKVRFSDGIRRYMKEEKIEQKNFFKNLQGISEQMYIKITNWERATSIEKIEDFFRELLKITYKKVCGNEKEKINKLKNKDKIKKFLQEEKRVIKEAKLCAPIKENMFEIKDIEEIKEKIKKIDYKNMNFDKDLDDSIKFENRFFGEIEKLKKEVEFIGQKLLSITSLNEKKFFCDKSNQPTIQEAIEKLEKHIRDIENLKDNLKKVASEQEKYRNRLRETGIKIDNDLPFLKSLLSYYKEKKYKNEFPFFFEWNEYNISFIEIVYSLFVEQEKNTEENLTKKNKIATEIIMKYLEIKYEKELISSEYKIDILKEMYKNITSIEKMYKGLSEFNLEEHLGEKVKSIEEKVNARYAQRFNDERILESRYDLKEKEQY